VAKVAEAMGVSSRTVEHHKQRFVEEGLESALVRKPLSSAWPEKAFFCATTKANIF
jgi:transposase